MPRPRTTRTERLLVPSSLWRIVAGLAVAVGGPFVAARLAMLDPFGRFPSLPFLVVIVGATMLGRLGTGAIAVIESILLLDYHFLGDDRGFSPASTEDLIALAGFGLVTFAFADILARRDLATARLEADRERLAFIGEVADALSGSLDYETRLRELVRVAVPRLGDWCAVHVKENGRGRVVAVAHVDPEKTRLAEDLQVRYPPDPDAPTGVPNVLRTGRSELYSKISKKQILQSARDDEHRRILRSLGLRSALLVPIKARDEVIGALTLISAESRRRYSEPDLALAEELGARAGMAIENARLYAERDHIAATLQRALLPAELPAIEGFELRALYRAALDGSQVGGDFYDVFPLPDGNWMAVIGDVCGKGPEAAALTGFVRNTIRALAVHETRPAAILHGLNNAMLGTVQGEQFSTVAVARIEPTREGARVVVSAGGHPRPVVLHADGRLEPVGTFGVIVGAFDGPRYEERRTRIRGGETLLLYTDGLTSKNEGDCFADDSPLCSLVTPLAGNDAQAILAAIESHVIGRVEEDPHDDVAVLALRVLPAAGRESSPAAAS